MDTVTLEYFFMWSLSKAGAKASIAGSRLRRRPSKKCCIQIVAKHHVGVFRAFSSTTAGPPLSVKEEHERRVAKVQAMVLERKHRRQNTTIVRRPVPKKSDFQAPSIDVKPTSTNKELSEGAMQNVDEYSPTSENASEIRPEVLNVLSNNIQNWCARDPTFLQATMKKLNLASVGVHREENPLTELVEQYRQLYYQSIPDFRNFINSETPNTLKERLDDLILAGFGDPSFSKRFRQVRGYESRKTQLQNMVHKQQAEVGRHKRYLEKTQAELNDLIYEARKSSVQQRQYFLKNLKRQQEALDGNMQAPSKKASLFSSIWSRLISWTSSPTEATQYTTNACVTIVDDQLHEKYFEPFALPAKSKQKRLRTKAEAVELLKKKLKSMEQDLQKDQALVEIHKFPLPEDDYYNAKRAVAKARDIICEELAKQISERHAQLIQQYQLLDAKTDLTKPWEWFGYARLDRRKVIFHSGPTNSGKTYNALQRLKEAKEGLYLGPLRLLAAEVYDGLTADGIYANLYTGQERRQIAFSTHAAATVEMANLEKEYDVVVIDEIQMISDVTRGSAWTKALLGLRCKEIHVCGGPEAQDIVRKLAKACGDEFEVKEYERFSPLKLATEAMTDEPTKPGCYRSIQPGDCVVAFSRNDIFAIKREIEQSTNYKCCVIYGKLPPQTRADQARRFNDPNSGYDILVASDAIGMGLNLNIKRVIFNSIFKYNGEKVVRLSHSEIKQISGRAGRRNSPYPHGEVTCRDPRDLQFINECLHSSIQHIEKAALLPTSSHIEVFRDGLEAYGVGDNSVYLHKILKQFSAMATVKGDFFLGRQSEMQMIAKQLKQVPLSLKDAYTLCQSPCSEASMPLLQNFAQKLSRGEICGLPSRAVAKPAKSFDDLTYLCNLYADADLFLWLQFKFPPSNAVEHQAALARKESVLTFINEALANTDKLDLDHDYVKTAMRHRKTWEAENPMFSAQSMLVDEDDEEDDMYAAFADDTRGKSYA